MKVIVLGGGLVGAPMAFDLANDFEVSLADINPNLEEKFRNSGVNFIHADLSSDKEVKRLVKDFDLVLNAVPGYMGFNTMASIISAGKNVIDIAFFPEDLFELDELCIKHNVTAISDIGVAPGMSNILIAYADSMLDETYSAEIYVGGLPKVRSLPWEYKAVFSPIDVIEEYTRPARYVKEGNLVIMPALTEPELMEFAGVGTLEAFNSDGLRSLIETIDCPDMIEKTLRYPGHIDKIKVLKESGFFSENEIDVKGVKVKAIDFTTSVLFPKWKLEKGEADITVMKVVVKGVKDNKACTYTWDLYDEFNQETGVHSMARTTGYTATMAIRMLAQGMYQHIGISPPEYVGKEKECVEFILKGLAERGVVYKESVEVT